MSGDIQEEQPSNSKTIKSTRGRSNSKISIDKQGQSSMQEPFVTTPKARKGYCRHHPNEKIEFYWFCEGCPSFGFELLDCKYCVMARERGEFERDSDLVFTTADISTSRATVSAPRQPVTMSTSLPKKKRNLSADGLT
jgi:hypothetical protein